MKKLVSLALVLMMVLSSLGNAGLRAYAAEEAPESSIAAEETAEKEVTEATDPSETEDEDGQDLDVSVESAEEADVEDVDAEDVDTEAVDDQGTDVEDAKVGDTDTNDVNVEDANVEAVDVEAADDQAIDTEAADVEDLDVENVDAEDTDAEDAAVENIDDDAEAADVEDAALDKNAETDSEAEETVVEISEDDSESESPSEDASAEQVAEEDKKATEEEPKRAAAKAASNGTTVLAFTSDVHNGTQSGGETNVSAIRMERWLSFVNPKYDNNISVMGFCGDMAAASSNSSTFWTFTETVMGIVDDHGFDGVYAVGNHEYMNGSFGSTSNSSDVQGKYKLNAEGRAVSGENYVMYCLGTNSSHGSSWAYDDSQVTTLTEYLNSVSNDKVIIILTHFPLHNYGSHRTSNTAPVLNAINNAAAGEDGTYGTADDKKIVFLWGHNHSEGDDHYDQVWIPGDNLPDSNNSISNFYYAAAGSMADAEYGSSAKVLGKGLVLTINAKNQLDFAYYNADGVKVGESYTEEDPIYPTSIVVSPETLEVEVGRSGKLSVSFEPAETNQKGITWASSDTNVATVDSAGKVKGVSVGTATITATSADGACTDTCTVTVIPRSTAQTYYVIKTGNYVLTTERSTDSSSGSSGGGYWGGSSNTYTGLAAADYSTATSNDEEISWIIEETDGGYYIMSLDGRYLNATYTSSGGSSWYGGSSTSDLKLDDTSDVWVLDSGVDLESWEVDGSYLKSTNSDRYLCEETGDNGSHLFSVRSQSNADETSIEDTSALGDEIKATAIAVSPKTVTVETGASKSLSISYTPSNTTNKNVTWTSSNTSIATVDSTGKVTGVAKGTATITATYAGDTAISDTCEVTVTKEAGSGVTPENGKKYVILASDGYALTSEGEEVGYSNGSSGQVYHYYGLSGEEYTVGENVAPDRLLWTFTASGAGYYIQDQNGKYLNGTYETNDEGGSTGRLKLDNTPDVWIISGAASSGTVNANILKSTNASTNASSDKYLTHGNGENGGDNTNIFTLRSEDNATSTTFYEYSDDGTYVPDPDDPTPVDPPVSNTVDITPTTSNPEKDVTINVGDILVINITNSSSNSGYDYTATISDISIAQVQGSATVKIEKQATGQITVKGLAAGTVDINIQNNQSSSQYVRKGVIHLEVVAPAHTHTYGNPVWSWAGNDANGYTAATATFTCTAGDDTQTVSAAVNSTTTAAKCETAGSTVYTATAAFNGTDYTDTKTVEIAPLGHDWDYENIKWNWTPTRGSGYNVSAEISCKNEPVHDPLVIPAEVTGPVNNVYTATIIAPNGATYRNTKIDEPVVTDGYTIYITANQEKVAVGDTVTFTITLGPVDHFGTMQMCLVIPDGLSYVENSFVTADGLKNTLGFDEIGWTPIPKRFDGTASKGNYSCDTETVLATFQCIVNESFTGAATVGLNKLEFYDCLTWENYTEYYSVENATVSLAGKFSVTFNMNGHGEAIDAQAVYEGDKAAEPSAPTADGYAFGGWYSDTALETEYNFNTPVTANIVLYAKWTADNYTIQFVNEDGTILQSSEVAYGATPSYTGTTPTKAATAEYAYTFDRWEPAITTVTDNKTYTAVFNKTARTYGDPEWTWTGSDEDGYTAAVATFTTNDGETEFTGSETDSSIDIQITDPTCTEAGQKVYIASVTFNGKSYNGSKTVEIEAIGHAWGEPTYEWAADNSTVTATRICAHDAAHKDTETAAVTSEVTKPATCEAKGETTYTAEFENEAFATQTLTVEDVEALGHNWKAPTYEWAEDYSSVTGTRVCANDETHKQTATVETSSYPTQTASCEENGVHLYVAIFTQEGFENQQKSVADIPALGHTWGEATYIWSDKYDSVYASHVCQVCGKSEIEVAPSTSEVTKEATCEVKGETTYTAVFAKDGFETQTKTVANIDAIGHDWDVPTYEWAADNSTVTASRVCKNDAAHVETETVETEYAVVTEATETAAGLGRYTSKEFKNEAFEIQTKDVTIQPTGFEVTYEWVEIENGGYQVSGTAVPYAEGAETITETVEAAYSVTTEPTCEKAGVGTWTAEFTKDQFTVQTKDAEIAAIGHEWGAASYTWAADNSKVTASRVCAHDETHIETETVDTTSEVTKAATCEQKGETTYTAEFENEAFETQTKTAANIDAIGHAWGEAAYEWADDYSSVSATRICANDAEHVETETVETASEVTKAATCEDKGETTYTAEFRNAAFETQTVTVENVDALGHDYAAVVTDPTCTEGGYTTYTCSRCGDSYVADETAALGHKWSEPTWNWADDYSTAEAKFVCENDGDHIENVEAEVTVEIKSGYVYTATVTGPDGESYSDEKKIEASNITSNTTSFDGKLFLNTYIVLSENVKADADAYVSVTFNDVTTKFSVADLLEDVDTQGRVRVRQEVYAAMMRDVMTLQLFNGQGEAQMLTYKETTDVTDGFQYSVLDYLKDRQENSTNPEMVELARAAELYGIASQVYFNYKTDQLTADDIQKMKAEAATITIPSTYAEELTGTLPAGISRRTKTVMFQSDNALRQNFYFADTDLWKYTFKLNGKTVAPTRRASGQYYVEQQNIASGLLSTVYTFTVTDGTNTFTIKSSALGYAYDRQENSTNQDMINLAKLLYLYSQAADAYFD